MRYVQSVESIRTAESMIRSSHPDDLLMQHAAFGISRLTLELLQIHTGGCYGRRVLLLVGSGDNGGDALWLGAYLARRGIQVFALALATAVHEEAKSTFIASHGQFISLDQALSKDVDLIVDGIFGIGFRDEIPIQTQEIIQAFLDRAPILSIDLPSGVFADTGAVAQGHVVADYTCVVGAYKIGVMTGSGKYASGQIELITIPCQYPPSDIRILDYSDLKQIYPATSETDHKYSRGVVVLDVGSDQFPGAGVLASSGARVSGAGMVQVRSNVSQEICVTFPDVVPTYSYERADAIVLGCGDSATLESMCAVLNFAVPVVLDAGAVNFLTNESVGTLLEERATKGWSTVITPHEGEAARLGFVSDNRVALAAEMSRKLFSVIVLKGPGTVIASPQGHIIIDTYGTSALACAGSGDVLAGLIGGTLATGHGDTLTAVGAAVALHGMAGRMAGSVTTAATLADSIRLVRQQMLDTQE